MVDTITANLAPELEAALMERIRAIPCFDTFNMRILKFATGLCEAVIPYNPQTNGIFESYHGGMLMAAADTTACFAMMTQTGAQTQTATTDMNIRFLAPCHSDVRVMAKVIKLGRTLCPVNVDLFDDNDRLVAVAQVNYIRLQAPSRPR